MVHGKIHCKVNSGTTEFLRYSREPALEAIDFVELGNGIVQSLW